MSAFVSSPRRTHGVNQFPVNFDENTVPNSSFRQRAGQFSGVQKLFDLNSRLENRRESTSSFRDVNYVPSRTVLEEALDGPVFRKFSQQSVNIPSDSSHGGKPFRKDEDIQQAETHSIAISPNRENVTVAKLEHQSRNNTPSAINKESLLRNEGLNASLCFPEESFHQNDGDCRALTNRIHQLNALKKTLESAHSNFSRELDEITLTEAKLAEEEDKMRVKQRQLTKKLDELRMNPYKSPGKERSEILARVLQETHEIDSSLTSLKSEITHIEASTETKNRSWISTRESLASQLSRARSEQQEIEETYEKMKKDLADRTKELEHLSNALKISELESSKKRIAERTEELENLQNMCSVHLEAVKREKAALLTRAQNEVDIKKNLLCFETEKKKEHEEKINLLQIQVEEAQNHGIQLRHLRLKLREAGSLSDRWDRESKRWLFEVDQVKEKIKEIDSQITRVNSMSQVLSDGLVQATNLHERISKARETLHNSQLVEKELYSRTHKSDHNVDENLRTLIDEEQRLVKSLVDDEFEQCLSQEVAEFDNWSARRKAVLTQLVRLTEELSAKELNIQDALKQKESAIKIAEERRKSMEVLARQFISSFESTLH